MGESIGSMTSYRQLLAMLRLLILKSNYPLLFIMDFDYIVIGAGASGLAFTALMQKRNPDLRIALLEAHNLVGGCSSYFERDGFIFDAGATTLSGFISDRPLLQLCNELDLNFQIKPIDPGIVSIFESKIVNRFKDEKRWRSELKQKFPHIDHQKFWDKIQDINLFGWKLSQSFSAAPIRDARDLKMLLNSQILKGPKALYYLVSSVKNFLEIQPDWDEDYLKMIDEMLFITAQNKSDQTPMLMGAMGLAYPNDTFYAIGGMKTFCEELSKKCHNLFLKNKVLSIHKVVDGFEVKTSKQIFKCKKIVSTLPIWNHAELFSDEKIKRHFLDNVKELTSSSECWGAFMLYFTVPKNSTRQELYFQIHSKEAIPTCDTHSYFASFSHPDDNLRNISGNNERQTVTISTHTKTSKWLNLNREEYENQKKETANFILKDFCKKLGFEAHDIQHLTTGSPKTFIRYTQRHQGLVGGIPHSRLTNPIRLLFRPNPIKNFYCLGDTQFPGQGIAAVVLGAQNLARKLS